MNFLRAYVDLPKKCTNNKCTARWSFLSAQSWVKYYQHPGNFPQASSIIMSWSPPKCNQCSVFSLYSLLMPIFELHIKESCSMSFGRSEFFNIIFVRETHVVLGSWSLWNFIVISNFMEWIYHNTCTHYTVDGHSDGFNFAHSMINAVINILVYISFNKCMCALLF